MIPILLLFTYVTAKLITYNTEIELNSTIPYKVFPFGNPSLFTTYGKPVFVDSINKTEVTPNMSETFVVFQNYQNFSVANLTLIAQNSLAVGAIFVSHSIDWDFTSLEMLLQMSLKLKSSALRHFELI